jgi:hypothetical protein
MSSRLIGRIGYQIPAWAMSDTGACLACGRPCAGVFDGKPGTWGNRRPPIRVGKRDLQRFQKRDQVVFFLVAELAAEFVAGVAVAG